MRRSIVMDPCGAIIANAHLLCYGVFYEANTVFQAVIRAFGQLPDPRIRNILLISVGCAALLLAVLVAGASWGLTQISLLEWGWANTSLQVLGGLITVILAWLLFPVVVVSLSGLFTENIARAVEARHYPGLPAPLENPIWRDIRSGLRTAGLALLLNMLALPAYLLLPGLNLALFVALNGFLLGREYFTQIAMRRMDDGALTLAWQRNRTRIWLSGMLLALLATVPLANLLTPILGTAFMLHVFEDLRRQGRLP